MGNKVDLYKTSNTKSTNGQFGFGMLRFYLEKDKWCGVLVREATRLIL